MFAPVGTEGDRQDGQDALEVRLEAEPSLSATGYAGLETRLAEELRYRIGVTIAVRVLAPGALPRYELKSRRIFDHRQEVPR
jgi:phenylacetate-CoA ligase